jgi:putative hydrolase of the HAD superfamily
MRPLKLITFDVTNTLIKVNGSPAYQYAAMAKQCGVAVEEARIQEAYKSEWASFRRRYPAYGAPQGMTCTAWWHQFVYNVFNAAGFRGSQHQLREVAFRLHSEFPKRADLWRVLPGATETLERLVRTTGAQIAVLSNFDDRLDDVLGMLALRHYFSVVVTSFEAGCEKPDPAVFQTILDRCGVEAEDAVHIGDNVEEDYNGALNAGMSAVLFDPDHKHLPFSPQPRGYSIDNLIQLFDTVQFQPKTRRQHNGNRSNRKEDHGCKEDNGSQEDHGRRL